MSHYEQVELNPAFMAFCPKKELNFAKKENWVEFFAKIDIFLKNQKELMENWVKPKEKKKRELGEKKKGIQFFLAQFFLKM